MTTVSWTLGSGSIPAGASVLFDDAADVNVARVDNLAAGTTSVDLPADVDTSQVATIKLSVSGSSSASWDFCLTSVTVSIVLEGDGGAISLALDASAEVVEAVGVDALGAPDFDSSPVFDAERLAAGVVGAAPTRGRSARV